MSANEKILFSGLDILFLSRCDGNNEDPGLSPGEKPAILTDARLPITAD
jgi:hypothetical protein